MRPVAEESFAGLQVPLPPEAERALLHHHGRFLAFLESRLESRAAAQDLLQSALVTALDSQSAPPDAQHAVRWLYQVLRNALVDHYRKQAAEGRALEKMALEPAAPPEDPELQNALCRCVTGLLPGLKPEYASIVQQVDLDGRPLRDVAEQLHITRNNATVRLHRARQALKRQLERVCGACASHGCLDCTCGSRQKPLP